ncbi:MAG: hypothetical protein GXC73_10485, partial [Chitinophagaceae bacterium]|nr:hypothetical protein [Chitinophagaceae bacterium]
MKKLLTCTTLLLSFFFASAQWYDPQKVDVKIGYKYAEGLNEARYRNY